MLASAAAGDGEARDERAQRVVPDALGVFGWERVSELERREPFAQGVELRCRIAHGSAGEQLVLVQAGEAPAEDGERIAGGATESRPELMARERALDPDREQRGMLEREAAKH